jgi:hypothetical protein
MTVDWDGKIRMDCSSPYAMTRLIALQDKFDIAFRQRHRCRPAWNRLPVGRPDEPELLSRGGDFLFVREPAGVAP